METLHKAWSFNGEKIEAIYFDPDLENEVIGMYRDDHATLREIANILHISHEAIRRLLKRNGISTAKSVACHVDTVCAYCERPFSLVRSRYKKSRHHFCKEQCYHDWLKINSSYKPASPSKRKPSYAIVEKYHGPIPEGAIVHHVDGNQFVSHPHNLILFKDQRDHIRWHRDFRDLVTPLWVGKEAVGWEELGEFQSPKSEKAEASSS